MTVTSGQVPVTFIKFSNGTKVAIVENGTLADTYAGTLCDIPSGYERTANLDFYTAGVNNTAVPRIMRTAGTIIHCYGTVGGSTTKGLYASLWYY